MVFGVTNPALGKFLGNSLKDIGYGLATSPTIGTAFGAAAVRQQEQQPYRDAYEIQQKQEADRQADIAKAAERTNATVEYFKSKGYDDLVAAAAGGAPMGNLWTEAINRANPSGGGAATSDIQNYEYGLANPGFLDFQTQKGGQAEVSLTPTWGIDTDPASPTFNRPVLGQLNKAGEFVKTQMPANVQPMNPIELAGSKTAATVDAKTAAGARAALPGAEQAVTIAKNAIALIRNDEKGLADQFGNTGPVPNRNLPVIPGFIGQDRGNWQANFTQANGQAFMQARQMLKGGGPITDYEGMKGEAAYSRMQAAVEKGDKANFLRALDDFELAVDQGYQKLVETANGAYSAGTPAVQSGPDYRNKYGLE